MKIPVIFLNKIYSLIRLVLLGDENKQSAIPFYFKVNKKINETILRISINFFSAPNLILPKQSLKFHSLPL